MGNYKMKKMSIILMVFAIVFLMVSSATAVPQLQNSKIDKILEQKENLDNLNSKLIEDINYIDIIIKLLQFLHNISAMILTIFLPLMAPLQRIAEMLENLLEKLEPWENLGIAILNVIEAIYALIEAIQNITDPPVLA